MKIYQNIKMSDGHQDQIRNYKMSNTVQMTYRDCHSISENISIRKTADNHVRGEQPMLTWDLLIPR